MSTTSPPDRPGLRRIALADVPLAGRRPVPGDDPPVVVTISVGQPLSVLHQAGYDVGVYLLELDADEQPVCAYHRGGRP